MTKHAIFSDTLRHGRLFELIRQDNMLRIVAQDSPDDTDLNTAELQRFLTRANRSFGLDNTAFK